MEIPILTDCINVIRNEIRSFQANQGTDCPDNAGKADFMAILAKIVNETMNKTVPAEKMKDLFTSSGGWLGMDKDKLMEMLDAEVIRLAEQMEQGADEFKAVNCLATSISEALNSFQNMGEINNHLTGADENNLLKMQLLNQSVRKTENSTDMSQSVDSVQSESGKNIADVDFSPALAKDIQQIIEKTAAELRKNLIALNLQETDNLTGQILIEKHKEDDNFHPIRRYTMETIADAKNSNKFMDDAKASILRPNVKASLNKDDNAFNITDYSAGSQKVINTTIQDKTLFDFSKDQSGQDKLNSHSNNKAGINEITPIDSRQTFSAFLNKVTQDESLSVTQRAMSIDSPDIKMEKAFILNSNEKFLKLTIEPEGIGMLDIELTLEKGVINAHILASDSAGKNLLDNNISSILNSLLREGLNMGKLSVSLGGKGNDTRGDNGEDTEKDSKTSLELDISNSLPKNHLISIFV